MLPAVVEGVTEVLREEPMDYRKKQMRLPALQSKS